uniref:GTP-binding protein RAD-like n=1 Tax=Myxine glutinosa TaxID=7769 RepID=UPI00358E45C3
MRGLGESMMAREGRRRGSTPLPLAHQRTTRGGSKGIPVIPRPPVARNPDAEHRGSCCSSESADSAISTTSETRRVVLLGAPGVGKSSLASGFRAQERGFGVEPEPGADDTYERSLVVDDEEMTLLVLDTWQQDSSQRVQEQNLLCGDVFLVVYSVTEPASLHTALKLIRTLRTTRLGERVPTILVGNKSDLVRARGVSFDEGRTCAAEHGCKFIETSAALGHNSEELLVGIVRQIRLLGAGAGCGSRHRHRRSLTEKACRLLGRFLGANSQLELRARSISCHDLSVP